MADKYPSAEVIGTDIAPVQPQWVPPNCRFQIDDSEQDWTFGTNTFDFIHCRDMYTGIRDWEKFIRQCYSHTKPGGWTEFCTIYSAPDSDDGSFPPTAALKEITDSFEVIANKFGADHHFMVKWKKRFEEAGFVDVVERIYKIPSSPWPKDKVLKKIGAFELLNIVEGAEGWMHRSWVEVLGRTKEELQMLVYRMRKELGSNKMHVWCPFYVVYGRKPDTS